MKIKTVHYEKKFSIGGYEMLTLGMSVEVDEEEKALPIFNALADQLEKKAVELKELWRREREKAA